MEDWKLPIFERHLLDGGFEYDNLGLVAPGVLMLAVETQDKAGLLLAVTAATQEAANTPQGTLQ